MNRRAFLAGVPLAFASCQSRTPTKPRADIVEREKHLAMLANIRVPANATRTTPKALVDVVATFPELKPLVKVANRLHPRFGDEPGQDESKLGGTFLWPASEDWPSCPEFRIPMVAVLQLRAEDVPPQFPMRPKCDLFQLFWSPRTTKSGSPHVIGIWRERATVTATSVTSVPDSAELGFVPVPCRMFPERIAELPPTHLMPKQMREKLEVWQPIVPYATQLAAACGTKVGGWPRSSEPGPKCLYCVHPMDYLLTVDSCEWTSSHMSRWKPIEDTDTEASRRAAGLDFGKPEASVQVSICRRCEKWPLRAVVIGI